METSTNVTSAGDTESGDKSEVNDSNATKTESRPFRGLIENRESLVSAVCLQDMELLCALLQRLPSPLKEDTQSDAQESAPSHDSNAPAPETGAATNNASPQNQPDASHRPPQNDDVQPMNIDTSASGDSTTQADTSCTTSENNIKQPDTSSSATNKEDDSWLRPMLDTKSELMQAMVVALTSGHAHMLDRLLEAGAQHGVNIHMMDEWCPLICTAAELGHTQLFTVLLKHTKNLNVNGFYGSVLHSAVRSGEVELVELLLEQPGMDVHAKSQVNDGTVLMDAVRCVRHERSGEGLDFRVLQLMLSRGCDVTAKDEQDRTALHYACMLGHRPVVQALLEAETGNERRPSRMEDQREMTPFTYALLFSQTHLYDLFIDVTGKVLDGHLIFAAKECTPQTVEYLLSKGANHLTQDDSGRTPLMNALQAENVENVCLLAAQRPAGMDLMDHDGRSAFFMAMQRFCESAVLRKGELAKALVAEGADIDIANSNGHSALLQWCRPGIESFERVEWLLQNGANPDYLARDGLYPLLAVCSTGSDDEDAVAMLTLLLRHNVDMTLSQGTDSESLTPLQHAVSRRYKELTRRLLAADVSTRHTHDWLATQDLPEDWAPLVAYIRRSTFTPMGLKGLARLRILKCLGFQDLRERTQALQVPVMIQQYLHWETYIEDRLILLDNTLAE